jgi:glycosyltransferase involved in cell wall biosynthesis
MTSHPEAISRRPVRLAYVVSHPIQYQAPLLRRIALEPDIDLTVFFGSDFSVRSYRDEGFGVQVQWDTPLLEGYRYEFLPTVRDTGGLSPTSPISRGLFTRLKRGGFDALWVHGYASLHAWHAIVAAKALGIPVLLRAESWLSDRERSPLKLAAKAIFFKALEASIDAVLPIGTENAAYWTHYFGDRIPQFPMPYAVDNAYFSDLAGDTRPRIADLRRELALEPNRPVILFASKLQPRKHADHLLEAYRMFCAHRDPATLPYLVIVGDGEDRSALEAQVARHGLADARFTGFRNQSELPRFFALADVFVLPSQHEPWGLIVNEAMASGCAVVVSSDVGCHADLVTDGIDGYVYPVGDLNALCVALEHVFATPQTPARMGAAASRRMATWSFEEDVQGLRDALAYTTRRLPLLS